MKKELKDALDACKKILFADTTPPAAPPSDAPATVELKAKDGTVYSVAKLENGEAITVNGEPAPDGEIELEDGKIIVVLGGVISEIKDAPAPAEVPAQMESVNKEDFDAVKNELTTLTGIFATLQENFTAIQAQLSESKRANEGKFKAVFDFYETMVGESEEKPNGQGANFSKNKTDKELKRETLKAAFVAATKKG